MSPAEQAAASIASLQPLARYRYAETVAEGYTAAGQPAPPQHRAVLEADVVDAEIVE